MPSLQIRYSPHCFCSIFRVQNYRGQYFTSRMPRRFSCKTLLTPSNFPCTLENMGNAKRISKSKTTIRSGMEAAKIIANFGLIVIAIIILPTISRGARTKIFNNISTNSCSCVTSFVSRVTSCPPEKRSNCLNAKF